MDFDLSQLDSVRNKSQQLPTTSKFHPKFAAKPVSMQNVFSQSCGAPCVLIFNAPFISKLAASKASRAF